MIEDGTIRKVECSFLFTFYSYGRVINRFDTMSDSQPSSRRTTAKTALMHSVARQKS